MKRSIHTLLTALPLVATLSLSGCNDEPAKPAEKPAPDVKTAAKNLAADVKDVAVGLWDGIKDYTHEKRVELANRFDGAVDAMDKKLDTLPQKTSEQRVKARREFEDAKAALKVKLAELRASSSDTWDATKEKTKDAWKRVEAAYDKLTEDES